MLVIPASLGITSGKVVSLPAERQSLFTIYMVITLLKAWAPVRSEIKV